MKFGEDVKLASHIVRGFHLAAERRSAQNHLPTAELHAIREIRMAAWELRDTEVVPFIGETSPEEGFEFADVELLSRANGSWFVSEVGHFRLRRHGYR